MPILHHCRAFQASILFDHPEACGKQPGHDAHWFPLRQTRLQREARCHQGEAGGWGEPRTRARARCGQQAGPRAHTASSLMGFFVVIFVPPRPFLFILLSPFGYLFSFPSPFSLVFAHKAQLRKGRLSTVHNITAHFFLLFTSKIPSSHI